LFEKERPRRVKPLLYVYRVLLTGIHLMRTGEVEANLVRLHDSFHLPQVPQLIARKVAGAEQSALDDADFSFHQREYERLVAELEDSSDRSHLPEAPTARAGLHDLLIRTRLGGPHEH
jgi:predicted nucleotidyltransferase